MSSSVAIELKFLKEIYLKIKSCVSGSPYKQWYKIILDIIETKLYVPDKQKVVKKVPKFRLNLMFTSKAFDFINLATIFKHDSCKNLFPEVMTPDDYPMVVYSLTKPIRGKIFNYTKFVSSIDFDAIVGNIDSIPCFCEEFDDKYIDEHHQHVLTGDLSIVMDDKLRKLLCKGPKYRLPTTIDFVSAIGAIETSLDELITKYSSSKNLPISDFVAWKEEVMRLIRERVKSLEEGGFICSRKGNILKDGSATSNALNCLQSKFVLCPTDKAANNVAIICKRLYAKIILKELDLDNGNSTYIRVTDRTEEEIVKSHVIAQAFPYDLKLPEDMQKLPPMHWIPKNHKNPVGSRFIIGSKMSSLKPMGKMITSIFKLIFKMKRRYFKKAGYFSGLKQFWPIDSHDEVVNALNRLSSKERAISIATYDFSTLYTKIPHNKLIEVLNLTAKSVFNDTDRKHLVASGRKAYFVKCYSSKFKFTADVIHECCEFLINNAYFRVGNAIFRQVIGIPMGSDPAPFFANLFLSHYEALWVKTHPDRAKSLCNTFRFIDDLQTLNDNGEFSRSYAEIYPEELELKKENEDSNLKASYLDLDISINGNLFEYELYDKRNAFQFPIVRFPFGDSNMPSKMFYATIGTEILRICRASSKYQTFINHCMPFIARMSNQFAKTDRMRGTVNRLLARHHLVFGKFGISRDIIVRTLFPNR